MENVVGNWKWRKTSRGRVKEIGGKRKARTSQRGTKEKWEGGVVAMARWWMKWKMEINKRWIKMEERCPWVSQKHENEWHEWKGMSGWAKIEGTRCWKYVENYRCMLSKISREKWSDIILIFTLYKW